MISLILSITAFLVTLYIIKELVVNMLFVRQIRISAMKKKETRRKIK